MKKVLLTLLFAFGIANISFAQRGMTLESVDYMESSARKMDMSHGIFTTPFVADIELVPIVDEITGKRYNIKREDGTIENVKRIEYKVSDPFKNYAVTSSLINTSINTFKAIALAETAKKFDADLIVGVLIDVRTNLNTEGVGTLEIIVSGYPARYCNFRTADMNDMKLIREASVINTYNANESDVVADTPEHKSSFLKENIQILK